MGKSGKHRERERERERERGHSYFDSKDATLVLFTYSEIPRERYIPEV